ncbi:hypothetical protein YC2023_094207 [Brassica napus]
MTSKAIAPPPSRSRSPPNPPPLKLPLLGSLSPLEPLEPPDPHRPSRRIFHSYSLPFILLFLCLFVASAKKRSKGKGIVGTHKSGKRSEKIYEKKESHVPALDSTFSNLMGFYFSIYLLLNPKFHIPKILPHPSILKPKSRLVNPRVLLDEEPVIVMLLRFFNSFRIADEARLLMFHCFLFSTISIS